MNNNACVFVGGLKATFTEEVISKFFGTFGEVASIELKKKKNMKNINRGFCVVTFADKKVAERVIKIKDHFIKRRLVTCRKYLRGDQLKESKEKKNERKIYISGLAPKTTNEDITNFFAKFGKVESGYTLKNEESGFSKGFGFVTFEDEEVAKEVLSKPKGLQINGSRIKIARFNYSKNEEEPQVVPNKPQMHPQKWQSAHRLAPKPETGEQIHPGVIQKDKKSEDGRRSHALGNRLGGLNPFYLPQYQNIHAPGLYERSHQRPLGYFHPNHGMIHRQEQQWRPERKSLHGHLQEIPVEKEIENDNSAAHEVSLTPNIEAGQVEALNSVEAVIPIPEKAVSLMKRKKKPAKCKAEHPSELIKTLEDHQLRPTMRKYHSISRNILRKSWHDLDISNMKLRIYQHGPRDRTLGESL